MTTEKRTRRKYTEYFRRDVMPIIEAKCLTCHVLPNGIGYLMSRLDMESYESLMAGTIYGPVIVPSDSRHSTLNMLVEGRLNTSIRTPHPLTATEIETSRLWGDQGAINNQGNSDHFVIPAKAGIQCVEITGFWHAPE